ncbi:glutaredoxin-like isoform X2 [Ceratina calcarata]|uniref:Glutaredoxin-2, mitochondrial n=1 Tax=Ceratina calcarata TaxID=156304 RepID=A0AAJ7S545_9HYME|nr:glutaredoxin-like isoform X2 [Ceratina calcarata]
MYSFLKNFQINMFKISTGFISAMEIMLENCPAPTVGEKNYETVYRSEETDMPVSKEEIKQLIESDAVVIFSKTKCPYCKMAKEVFNKLQKKYTAIELDEWDNGDEIQTILGEMTGARTVPRVFVNGVCLGGGSDVKKLYDSGELQKKF